MVEQAWGCPSRSVHPRTIQNGQAAGWTGRVMADDRGDVTADAAGSRLERLRTAGAWGSLFSAQDFAAITSVGFDPVGDVLGTSVVHLGYASRGGKCSGMGTYASRTDLASAMGGPFGLLLRKRYGVRHQALSRATEECRALGGDGIVGVTMSIRPFPAGGTEFTVQGTAIRGRTGIRPAAPFSSQLSAPEFARLLRAGWVPTALVFGIALGARHDDLRTRNQARRTAAISEVRGYSELVKDTRRDARQQLEKAVADQGADGVVVSEITLHLGERECPAEEGMHDHVAEAAIMGTTIASFDRSAGSGERAPLTIMYLNPSPAAATGLRPDSAPQSPPRPDDSEGGFLDRLVSARAARSASRSVLSYADSTTSSKKAD
jgi:uncharacterized protein YbjQ (UPF0145 family)